MSDVGTVIGAGLKALREQRSITQQQLADKVSIPLAELEAIEAGAASCFLRDVERIGAALGVPFRALVSAAYAALEATHAPRINPAFLRRQVPLPGSLTHDQLAEALNHCQNTVHIVNKNMREHVGLGLHEIIQGNNFSGLVSNLLTDSMHQCTPFKHNHHQKYPDLVEPNGEPTPPGGSVPGVGLEVKTTIKPTKGGESHNGHSGWHMIAAYCFTGDGDILFTNVMLACLVAHNLPGADWKYVGSVVDDETGSRRTETYNTTGPGTCKLRDGCAYFDSSRLKLSGWRETRHEGTLRPAWSLFNDKPAPATRRRSITSTLL